METIMGKITESFVDHTFPLFSFPHSLVVSIKATSTFLGTGLAVLGKFLDFHLHRDTMDFRVYTVSKNATTADWRSCLISGSTWIMVKPLFRRYLSLIYLFSHTEHTVYLAAISSFFSTRRLVVGLQSVRFIVNFFLSPSKSTSLGGATDSNGWCLRSTNSAIKKLLVDCSFFTSQDPRTSLGTRFTTKTSLTCMQPRH